MRRDLGDVSAGPMIPIGKATGYEEMGCTFWAKSLLY
jgi:hypothetical protein